MRLGGAGVVALRVVAALALGHRPHTEATRQASTEEVICDRVRLAPGKIPLRRRCPMFEVTESTRRPSPSRAKA